MTTHYIDLKLVPDPETNVPQLLGVLYDRLHKALVEGNRKDIGVSFPGYSLTPLGLGHKLRLHGHQEGLQNFMADDWLKGVRDHIRQSEVSAIPGLVQHRSLYRRQFKTNVERLRRRRMKRKGETREEVVKAIPSTVMRRPKLPFVHLHSQSTKQAFCLFLEQGQFQDSEVEGDFNSYGLSCTATVPWF